MLNELPTDPIQGLTRDVKDAAALAQAQLREGLDALDRRVAQLESDRTSRRRIALVLKVVSVLSGIIIATGFLNDNVVQVMGAAVSAIAALERVFANLDRLLAVTAARNAYARVRREIELRHNRAIIEIVRIRDTKPQQAIDRLLTDIPELRDTLGTAKNDIENKLEQNDYDSLGTVTLQDKAV